MGAGFNKTATSQNCPQKGIFVEVYSTYYVVHKVIVRKLYIYKFRKFLFNMKKVVYPPLPFCIGSYKFSKIKSALEFVRELKSFHFREKHFHRNDSSEKVSKYCATVGVHFEYTNHWDKDEEIYHNACSMFALSKRFKKKIMTVGGKGSSSSTIEHQKKNEEVGKKREEEAQILLQEAKK